MRSINITSEQRHRTFITLDGIRGLAALAVVFLHYQDLVEPIQFGSAYLAVDIFFLMSGFVLANAYEDRLKAGWRVEAFIGLRLLRLYPLYALGTAIAIAGIVLRLAAQSPIDWTLSSMLMAIPGAMLMLPSVPVPTPHDTLYPFNFPAWSLFWEVIVNVIYAAIVRRLGKRTLGVIIIGSALALIVAAALRGDLNQGVYWNEFVVGLPRVSFGFFAGVGIYRLYVMRSLPFVRLPVWLLLSMILLVFMIDVDGVARIIVDCAIVLIVFPLLVTIGVQIEPRLGGRLLTIVGLASYPIYVIHVPARVFILGLLSKLSAGQPYQTAPVGGVVTILLLVVASWSLANHYDAPVRARIGRMLRRR